MPTTLLSTSSHSPVCRPAHLDSKRAQRLSDRTRAANRARGPVESCEEAVARGVELDAAILRELAANRRVMLRKQLTPAAITELRRLRRRADDIREQDRCEHSIVLDRTIAHADRLEEVADCGDDGFPVA